MRDDLSPTSTLDERSVSIAAGNPHSRATRWRGVLPQDGDDLENPHDAHHLTFTDNVSLRNELLILLLSPPTTVSTDGPAHVTAINHAFYHLRNSLLVRIRQSVAGTLHDIGAAFEEHLPRALHIVTHGNGEAIVINNGNNQPAALDAGALVERYHLSLPLKHRHSAKLAFITLGACYSDVFVTKLVPQMAHCGIGLSGLISPDSAQCFYSLFYHELAYGRSVADAFGIARMELESAYSMGHRAQLVDPRGVAHRIYFPQYGRRSLFGARMRVVGCVVYLSTLAFVVWWLLERFA